LSAPIKDQLTVANTKAQNNPTADNIGMLGMAYHSCVLYDQAANCYKLAIRKNRSKWIWNYYLGYLNQELSDSKSAIENFSTVIRKNPKVYQAYYYLGKAYQTNESDKLAEQSFNKIAFLKDNTSDFTLPG
jgi:tetratricopeptide (TPR) repeat protein